MLPAALLALATGAGLSRAPSPPLPDPRGHAGLLPDTTPSAPPSSAFLALLPDGEEKRRFILDCTGCHPLDAQIAFPAGRPRDRDGWAAAVSRMLGYAGAHAAFPVIGADREPAATAEWLARYLTALPGSAPPGTLPAGATLTEYPLPEPRDLPHDLAVDGAGRVVITGMLTDRMYILDPAAGTFDTLAIPVARANPRSLELDASGRWWVFLGAPGKVARFDPATREWASWDAGMYAHEVRVDAKGRAWFNGHFSRDPEVIGYVDPRTGARRTFAVPTHPEAHRTGPIPYGLRVAPDGSIWGTELHGNRIVRLDPDAERFEIFTMPTPHSGPRRIAFDAAGNLWIPAYAANRLVKLDPRTRRFTEYELPIPDALPYVAEVDPRTGRVWLGTGAADALLAFEPERERFTVYPLPTRGALVRHIAVDAERGDVWAAYGASPGIPARVARLRPGERPMQ